MKKTLIEKNKQIEELMKKNKLLSYQLENGNTKTETVVPKRELFFEDQPIKRSLDQDKKNKELMDKIEEMSEILMKEEAEKL